MDISDYQTRLVVRCAPELFISADCLVTNNTGSMSFTSICLPLLPTGVFDVVLNEARNLRTNSRTETPHHDRAYDGK